MGSHEPALHPQLPQSLYAKAKLLKKIVMHPKVMAIIVFISNSLLIQKLYHLTGGDFLNEPQCFVFTVDYPDSLLGPGRGISVSTPSF